MNFFQAICAAVMISVAAVTYDAPALVPIDAVLVLDVSRSMQTADPYRISRDAMNLFIDKLAEDRDRVGVVAYAGRVESSREMTAIYDVYDREALRDFINGLEYASWTDHGLGLLEAVRIMYDAHDNTRQPIIIFLTDGNLNPNPHGARTFAQAEYDIALALALAQQHGFPIYTIGLNFDGELDRATIDSVADATGGISFETANAEDLPGIISVIFSVMQPMPQAVVESPTQPIPESAPEHSPVIVPFEPEIIYIEYEPIYEYEEIYEYEQINPAWIFVAVITLLTAFLLFRKLRVGKRVFTGCVVLVVDGSAEPPLRRNLIEYGRKTTLARLLGGEVDAVFDKVVIMPSPDAPSHLPQLILKCKDSRVKFVKDFVELDAQGGMSLNPGMDVGVRSEDALVLLKYTDF